MIQLHLATVQSTFHTNIIERTNKMQPCSRTDYSNVSELLNMLRATHRPSPGAQKLNCSLLFYIRLWLPVVAMAIAATGNHKRM
jgi:hypothetical protein